MSDRRLILRLGPCRCGTVFLSSLLDAQPNTCVVHEGHVKENRYNRVVHEASIEESKGDRHLFRWNGSSQGVLSYLENLSAYLEAQRFGDVDYYCLHVEPIFEKWPDAKFVVLKRNRSATVDSCQRKTRARNHWMDHDGSQWQTGSAFDSTFPTLNASPKRVAVGRP